MRTRGRASIALAAALLSAFCGDPPTREETPTTTPPVDMVIIWNANLAINAIGQTLQLTAKAYDSGGIAITTARFTWVSDDAARVRVSASGLATAVAWGTAHVTASSGGRSDRVMVEVRPPAPSRWSSIDAGGSNTCGLAADLTAYCWGNNFSGQIGDGGDTTLPRATPVAIQGAGPFVTLLAGSTPCGLTSAGTAYCWGWNNYGQVGDGSTGNRHGPVAVGGTTFRSLADGSGWRHACGVTADGSAYCWGSNQNGEVGDGTTGTTRLAPTRVAGGLTFSVVVTGGYFTCGLTTDGRAYCWGANGRGSLGDGTWNGQTTPVAVTGGQTFVSITAGNWHACALTAAGAAWCWGDDLYGQLGDGSLTNRSSPVAVTGGLTFAALSAGDRHTCGLLTTGAAYCWGDRTWGNLGDGVQSGHSMSPVPVSGGITFRTLTAGNQHTCGLVADGAAYCWGDDWAGQLGDGASGYGTVRTSPVRVRSGVQAAQQSEPADARTPAAPLHVR